MFRGSPSTSWATKEALTQDSHEGEVWGTRGELPLVGMGVWGLILASWFPMVEISVTAGGVDTRTGLANKGLPVLLLYCLLGCIVKLCLWDLSIADAWSTVTDACVVWCVLVTLFVPPRSVGLTFEVFWRSVVRKRAPVACVYISVTWGTPVGSSRDLNFSPYFVYISYVFQLLLQVITKQIVKGIRCEHNKA